MARLEAVKSAVSVFPRTAAGGRSVRKVCRVGLTRPLASPDSAQRPCDHAAETGAANAHSGSAWTSMSRVAWRRPPTLSLRYAMTFPVTQPTPPRGEERAREARIGAVVRDHEHRDGDEEDRERAVADHHRSRPAPEERIAQEIADAREQPRSVFGALFASDSAR